MVLHLPGEVHLFRHTSPFCALRSRSPPPVPYADVKNTLLFEKIGVAMFAVRLAAG